MLIVVSDLHLCDVRQRTAFTARGFVEMIERLAASSRQTGVKDVTLLLLGDIFEVLKSTKWVEAGVRPWQPVTEQHTQTVAAIINGIINENAEFITGLSLLRQNHGVAVEYVVGNHDQPVVAPMGALSQQSIIACLGLNANPKQAMLQEYSNQRYRVLAKHGHEWDAANRYTVRGAAVGDAVVIEVLVQLPLLVARKLGIPADDPRLSFLWAIDSVRPGNARTISRWLAYHLTTTNLSKQLRSALMQSLEEISESLRALINQHQFELPRTARWWANFLLAAKELARGADPLKLAQRIPSNRKPDTYAIVAESALSFLEQDQDLAFFLCGHTHIPELVPVASERSCATYLNTGTWRAMHQPQKGAAGFVTVEEHCLVVLFDESERRLGYPSCQFHRIKNGPSV